MAFQTWYIYIYVCTYSMKSRYNIKFSTNVFMVESLVSLRHRVLVMMFKFYLVFLKIKFSECKETWWTSFVCQELKLLRSWKVSLKTPTLFAVTAEVTELNNRKNPKKTPCISSQRTIMEHE